MGPIYQHFDPSDRKYFPIWETAQESATANRYSSGYDVCQKRSTKVCSAHLVRRYRDFVSRSSNDNCPYGSSVGGRYYRTHSKAAQLLLRRVCSDSQALQIIQRPGACDGVRCTGQTSFEFDYPVITPSQTIEGLKSVNNFAENTNLPKIPTDAIEAIISRNAERVLKRISSIGDFPSRSNRQNKIDNKDYSVPRRRTG